MTGRAEVIGRTAVCVALFGVSCSDPGAANHSLPLDEAEQVLTEHDASTMEDDRCRYFRHRDRKIWGCIHDLPVGPRARGAPPSDWGICGITMVIGNTDDHSVLRILVGPSGHYRLLLGVGNRTSHRLDVRVNCLKWRNFRLALGHTSERHRGLLGPQSRRSEAWRVPGLPKGSLDRR